MKTVFIGLNWLGDIIMSFPAIIKAAQEGEIHIVTRSNLAQVYSLLPVKHHLYKINDKYDLINLGKIAHKIGKLKPERIIILPQSARSAITAFLCGGLSRIGYATQMRGLLLTDARKLPDNYKQIHESILHLALVDEGCGHDTLPDLSAASFSATQIHDCLTKFGLSQHENFIVLAPGAAFGAAKRWPLEKFAELKDLIVEKLDHRIVLTAGAAEIDLAKGICGTEHDKIINLAGKTNLIELAILLGQASALVANDSGTMHLAALYQTPTVIPVGPTDMVRTGPLNANAAFIIDTSCEKAPCRQRICPLKHHQCMQNIEAISVFEKLHELIKPR